MSVMAKGWLKLNKWNQFLTKNLKKHLKFISLGNIFLLFYIKINQYQ